MTYTEVLELIRAGYNKEEIESMMKAEEQARPAPKQDPAPINQQDEPPEVKTEQSAGKAQEPAAPEQKPEPKPKPTETEKLVAALGMKFDALTSALHAQNVRSMEGTDNQTTTEDIIARIINPHYGEG